MATHRAVISVAEAGVVYEWPREGTRHRQASGITLDLNDENEVRVLCVDRPDGPYLERTGPAELDVYLKGDGTTSRVLLQTIVAAAQNAGREFVFALTTDFAGYGQRGVDLVYRDSTLGALSVKPGNLIINAHQGQTTGKALVAGTWAIVSGVISDLGDKRIDWRSSDPSVLMVIPGAGATAYDLGTALPAQGTEFCLVIGVKPGEASVIAKALGNELLTDTCAVTVKGTVPPTDTPLADRFEAAFKDVVVGISGTAIDQFRATDTGVDLAIIDERQIVVPGTVDQLFKVQLSYAGTVPKWHAGSSYLDSPTVLAISCVGGSRFGVLNSGLASEADMLGAILARLLGVDCAKILNSTGTGTVALNSSVTFFCRGGDIINFGFYRFCEESISSTPAALPSGQYTCEFDADVLQTWEVEE